MGVRGKKYWYLEHLSAMLSSPILRQLCLRRRGLSRDDIRELDEFILDVDLPDGWQPRVLAVPIFRRRRSSPREKTKISDDFVMTVLE